MSHLNDPLYLLILDAEASCARGELDVKGCPKCTGAAVNHYVGHDSDGALIVECIGIAPATVALRRA